LSFLAVTKTWQLSHVLAQPALLDPRRCELGSRLETSRTDLPCCTTSSAVKFRLIINPLYGFLVLPFFDPCAARLLAFGGEVVGELRTVVSQDFADLDWQSLLQGSLNSAQKKFAHDYACSDKSSTFR
jgi:hypothetical protein